MAMTKTPSDLIYNFAEHESLEMLSPLIAKAIKNAKALKMPFIGSTEHRPNYVKTKQPQQYILINDLTRSFK